MKYLVKTTETYRFANENQVADFLAELKKDDRFEVAKYGSTKRQLKAKGEIIDEWIRFEVTKIFNEEKEPSREVEVEYEIDGEF